MPTITQHKTIHTARGITIIINTQERTVSLINGEMSEDYPISDIMSYKNCIRDRFYIFDGAYVLQDELVKIIRDELEF